MTMPIVKGHRSGPPYSEQPPASVFDLGGEAKALAMVPVCRCEMRQQPAELRHQAEHCRRLALSLLDEPTIAALLAMAQEFDEKAEQLEPGNGS